MKIKMFETSFDKNSTLTAIFKAELQKPVFVNKQHSYRLALGFKGFAGDRIGDKRA